MKRLLVVDDEANIRNLIKKYAQNDGYIVDEAQDGMIALDILEKSEYDLVVLDLMMPNLNGLDTCKMIREFSDVPIIILTARQTQFDKYQGFELGIDDYVVKPFSPKELMYRVEAVLKRYGHKNKDDIFVYKGLEVDFQARKVMVDNNGIDLSLKEYALLNYFIQNKNIALERDLIINKVWGFDFDGDDRTLDTHIKRLRKKINPYQDMIKTLRGVGYRFEVE